MKHHEAFLHAIAEEREDDTSALVYADWLDEHGDSDRAEFIRLQCERERLDPHDPRGHPLHERETQLLAEHKRSWVPDFAVGRDDVHTIFSRGLLTYLGGERLTDMDLRQMRGNLELRSMILEGEGITDAGMKHLLTLPHLEKLYLNRARITNKGLRTLARHPELRILGGSESGMIDDEGLRHLLDMPRLLAVNFSDEDNRGSFSEPALAEWLDRRTRRWRALAPAERRREALYLLDNISDYPQKREGGQVKRVYLQQCTFGDADVEFFTTIPELEEIELNQTQVTGSGFHHLAGLMRLRGLKLNECDALADISGLAGLTGLQELRIERYSSLIDEATAPLETLTGLRSLALAGDALTEATLQRLARLTELERLELFNFAEITEVGLSALAGLKRLRSLEFWGTARINRQAFATLAGLRQLETLRAIHGFDPELTGRARRQLGALTNLKVLDLRSYHWSVPIPYTGLRHLHALCNLEWLVLPHDEKLSAETVDELLASFPTATIAVGQRILDRVDPNPPFTRRDIDDFASIEIPAGWSVRAWKAVAGVEEEQFTAAVCERDFENAGISMAGLQIGVLRLSRRRFPSGKSLAEGFRQSAQNLTFHTRDAGESVDSVEPPPGVEEACSWHHTSYGGMYEHLDFVWRTGQTYYALHCQGPRARWGYLEPYFTRVAGSFSLAEGL